MINFDTVMQRMSEMDGVDVQAVIDFIEDMKQANTSLYYTEEKRRVYQSIDLAEVKRILTSGRNNNRQAMRISLLKSKIMKLKNTKLIDNTLYF